jgi:dUTPase
MNKKYKKTQEEFEAIQLKYNNIKEVMAFVGEIPNTNYIPPTDGEKYVLSDYINSVKVNGLFIKTVNSNKKNVKIGDYIVKDINENFQVYNSYIFNKTYGEIKNMKLQVRYIDKNITPMQKIDGGDLVDLRVSRVFKNGEETNFPCKYSFGDTLFFKLGFAMKMPTNKKANVYPRSGMFKNYGFILTNSVGQIDNKFQGNTDEWCAMMYCTRDGEINYDDRILQFEVVDRVMENVEFEIVEQLGDINRGGYSSTGVK